MQAQGAYKAPVPEFFLKYKVSALAFLPYTFKVMYAHPAYNAVLLILIK